MREFLLCILICCLSHLAFGQDNMRDSCWQERVLYGVGIADASVDTGDYTPHEVHMKLWFIRNFQPLVEAWEMYEAECWADSTKHERSEEFGWRNVKIPGLPEGQNEYQVWTQVDYKWGIIKRHELRPRYFYLRHRNPTFPGFMEFLKRKVKP